MTVGKDMYTVYMPCHKQNYMAVEVSSMAGMKIKNMTENSLYNSWIKF
jgi:hypothetical protein